MEKIFKNVSVHELVDFLLRKGDIDTRVYNFETMQMGSKIHSSYQSKQGKKYLSEVPLKTAFSLDKGTIVLEGRADGIILGGEYPIVDEIKSTVSQLNEFYEKQKEWHLGQAGCYAYMYAKENNLEKMGIKLTYISQETNERMVKDFSFTFEELEENVTSLVNRYLDFLSYLKGKDNRRNESIKALSFPYATYRKGQKAMMKNVYEAIDKKETLFMEAPTGIGKTISALYPSLKAISQGKGDKIFYLTAKTTGRESAYDALTKLYEKGLIARDSILKAKDKMCPSLGKSCNPDECKYAKGYYDKIGLVRDIALRSEERFSSDYVEFLGEKYEICPFELSLDLSLYSDVIICDYNYLFDPIVYLDRYFGDQIKEREHIALIDESHNMIDRAKDMYSSTISTKMVKDAKASIKKIKSNGLKSALTKLFNYLDGSVEEGIATLSSFPEELTKRIDSIKRAEKKAKDEKTFTSSKCYDDLSKELHRLSVLSEGYTSSAAFYFERINKDVYFHFANLDPSPYIASTLSKLKSSIFFSATLSPISFYKESIEGHTNSKSVLFDSPFDHNNMSLTIVPNVSVRYKDRESSYRIVAEYLERFVNKKVGNYFIYFPSYEYLNKIRETLSFENADVYVQERKMKDEEKKDFLSFFKPNPTKTAIGLLVLGGAFGEGVDLIGDRLSGVAIVGIGMPTIGFERNLIKEHFNEKGESGFSFAYLYPGMNRVMQALGRLIRSESDKGAALLIDDRYLNRDYREVYGRLYPTYSVAYSVSEMEEILDRFYKE